MKIDRIELFHVAIPLARPFHPAWIPGYPQTANRFTLARLTTDDGVRGIAAGVAFEREREGLGSLLGPYLIGLDPTDIEAARQRLREASFLGWRNYWLEAAFWDIRGQVEGKPLWQMLGGREGGRVPVYASTGEVHDPAQRAEEVQRLREQGFGAVKLRVHSFDSAEDIAQIETVRRAAGDGLLAKPILADSDGTIAVPEAPGLGVVLDDDKLVHFGEKFFKITSRGIAVKTIREKGLFTALGLARRKRRR